MCATGVAAQERCTKVTGGEWATEAGVGVKAQRHDVTVTAGWRYGNVARTWRGPVVKEEATCGAATGTMEWGGGGAT